MIVRSHALTLPRCHAPTLQRRFRTGLLLISVCAFAVAACEEELRVPYIPPALANWPQPYRGVAGLKVHVFNTGYLRVPEALILRGGSMTRRRDLPAPVVLIVHPKQGLVLFNTGLTSSPADAAPEPPAWASLLGAEVLPGKDLKSQLQVAGFKPDTVRWIVLSSLRFDRSGAVEAFPNARVVVSKVEHDYARHASSGYRASTFDDVANWKFIDFSAVAPVATFPASVDLFGDGSCLLLDASGSTPGAMALLVRLPHQPLLLADGLAAVNEQVRYAAKPAAAHDLRQWWDHIWRLKKFKDVVPELIVLPGHDLQPIVGVESKDIVVHEIVPPATAAHPTPTPGLLQRLIPKPL